MDGARKSKLRTSRPLNGLFVELPGILGAGNWMRSPDV